MHITFLKLSFQTKRKNLTTRRKVIIVMDSIVLRVSNRKLNRKERSDAATGSIYIYTRLNIQTIANVSFESPAKFHGLIFTILNSFPRFPPEYLSNIRIIPSLVRNKIVIIRPRFCFVLWQDISLKKKKERRKTTIILFTRKREQGYNTSAF